MRIVYFVLSHTNVPHVVRLIRRIEAESPNASVLVHHDAAEVPFDRAAFSQDPRVLVMDRWIHGEWAQFSLVEIVLAGIEELARRRIEYDWLVLLSGQDYPVRPLREFESALESAGDGFLETDLDPGSLLDRYTFAWRRFPAWLENGITHRILGALTRFNGRQNLVRFLSGRVGCRIGFALRTKPVSPSLRFYKGTQWWALSSRAIAYVRTFVSEHPDYVRHFRDRTIIPDESFFQTMLMNARGFSFVNDDRRFTKWGPPGSASPEILRLPDYAAIVASGDFFARKFDPTVDERIIAAFD